MILEWDTLKSFFSPSLMSEFNANERHALIDDRNSSYSARAYKTCSERQCIQYSQYWQIARTM